MRPLVLNLTFLALSHALLFASFLVFALFTFLIFLWIFAIVGVCRDAATSEKFSVTDSNLMSNKCKRIRFSVQVTWTFIVLPMQAKKQISVTKTKKKNLLHNGKNNAKDYVEMLSHFSHFQSTSFHNVRMRLKIQHLNLLKCTILFPIMIIP